MKKILLIAPDHVGILRMINEQLQGDKEYSVDFIDLVLSKSEEFRYKNFAQRVQNFYLKNFKGKNLKHAHYPEQITEKIKKVTLDYDVIIVIRPDLLGDDSLQHLRSYTKQYVAYYWDPVSFYSRKLEISHFFDKVYSFDINDCHDYGFEFLTNFYLVTAEPAERKYDVYGIASHDKRTVQLEKMAEVFEAKAISYCIKVYTRTFFKNDRITCITEIVDYRQMLEEASFCNVMVEIQKEGQGGLTFRPFEAMGMKKKLITNNPLIKNYDFYSAHNICVIDPENISIPPDFFSTPYQDIDAGTREQYSFSNWFNKLVSPLPVNFAL